MSGGANLIGPNLIGLSRAELTETLAGLGEKAFRAKQL